MAQSLLSIYFLCNAYIGSAECMKEVQFGDMQRDIQSVPIFIEQFCHAEADFAAKRRDLWRCDSDRDSFAEWSAWRDVLERLAMPKQGAYTPLALEE